MDNGNGNGVNVVDALMDIIGVRRSPLRSLDTFPPYPDPTNPGPGSASKGENAEQHAETPRPPTESILALPNIDPDALAVAPPDRDVPFLLQQILSELQAVKPGGRTETLYDRQYDIPAGSAGFIEDFFPLPVQNLYVPAYVRANGIITISINGVTAVVLSSAFAYYAVDWPVDFQSVRIAYASGDAAQLHVVYATHPFVIRRTL